MRVAVWKTSPVDEQCAAGDGPIPAGDPHICSWEGKAEAVRIEHEGCVLEGTVIHQSVTGFLQDPAILAHIHAMAVMGAAEVADAL